MRDGRDAGWNRREFLNTLGLAGTAGLLGLRPASAAAEPPPETTRLRMTRIPGICVAPQYVAQELLLAEGFTDLKYVDFGGVDPYAAFASGQLDISMAFVPPFLVQVDAGLPIVLLAGVHAGCFELFGTGPVHAIRDLKHRSVAVPVLGSAHHAFVASMAVYVGVDPQKDIKWVTHPIAESAAVLATGKADALVGLPPVPQELRARRHRPRHCEQLGGSAMVPVLLLHRRLEPGLRKKAPGGDQAGAAGLAQGHRPLRDRSGAGGPAHRRPRLHAGLPVRAAGDAGDPLQPLAVV